MEPLILTLADAGMLLVIALIANVLGYVLTEVFDPVIAVKPFTCRPCLTFWLTLLGGWAFSWYVKPDLLADFWPVLATVLLAFINYLYLITKIKIVN